MALLALVLTGTVAGAQNIDCSTVQLDSIDSLWYDGPGNFPNTKENVYISLDIDKIDFNQCGLTVSSDGIGNWTVNAGSREKLASFLKAKNSDESYFHVLMVGDTGYQYPTLKQGYYFHSVSFMFDLDSNEVYNPQSDEDLFSQAFLNDATIGYKVNDGPITPYFYKGEIIPATLPVNTKTIDIFSIRKGRPIGSDHVRIDLEKGSYQVWKEFAFPAK